MKNKIIELILASGVWYSSQNYQVFTPEDFIKDVGENNINDELKEILISEVEKIQRQCDSYAIELKSERKPERKKTKKCRHPNELYRAKKKTKSCTVCEFHY